MKTQKLLIDADMVAYQITSGIEQEIRWEDEIHTLHSDFKDAIAGFYLWEKRLEEELRSPYKKTKVYCFSDTNNFRKNLHEDYKSNRKKTRKPLAYSQLKEWIMDKFDAVIYPNLEADDVLGILQTSDKKDNIIVSDDKDLLTIPGRTYRLGQVHDIDEQTAKLNWYTQTLAGDTADGYKGCPGIGPKKAEVLLSKSCEWPTVVGAFKAAGLTEDDAIIQAQLAKILTVNDWNKKKREPILWNPKI